MNVQAGQPPAPASQDGRPRFNKSVHGARGLFAFLVFVFHVVNSGLATLPLLETGLPQFVLRMPEYGVELFFCISGFVITGTLRRARSPAAFLEDRAIRIYPVLAVTILAIVTLGLLTGVHGYGQVDVGELVWRLPVNLLALPGVLPIDNIHPAAWSLSYELTFYLFCAACWALRRPLGRALPWVAAPVALAGIVFYPRAVFLLTGVLVALGWPRAPALRRVAAYPLPLLFLFLCCWRGIQDISLPTHIILTNMVEWAGDARLPLAVAAFAFATLGFAGLVAGEGWFGRVLQRQTWQFMGTISYSFYLWHPIVMSGVKTELLRSGLAAGAGEGAWLLFFVAALPPSLVVAAVSERLLERRLAVWLRARLHHPPPMPPPLPPAPSIIAERLERT